MSRPIRVVHLPARTPYVRKILSADIHQLNGTNTRHGIVPASVSATWLLRHRPLDWLDVLHLHHIEFEDIEALERLLSACADHSIRVVYTAHDVEPMFLTPSDFHARMNLIAQAADRWVGLTESSVAELRRAVPHLPPIDVIPHGFVVPPDQLYGRRRDDDAETISSLMYGALRPNRDLLAAVSNWTLSEPNPNAKLDLLLRPFSPADFARHDIPALLSVLQVDQRIRASIQSYRSDSVIAEAGLDADVLLLPYLYGSHSGQLEFAFDLNLIPMCANVGHLKQQYSIHSERVDEPVWFDWGDGRTFQYGERFVRALEEVRERLADTRMPGPDRTFLDYRRDEHSLFLERHRAIYAE
ncbi:hypothetical protein OHB12_22220 [Nocardia sp. NBC_01730]|uniref:hypothetical protein n=1 Tax=Nocardia sp. NBC_01730 TaxID=2975998 RepID=UPI002E14A6A4|nr:hypothetical protein OHB12_22220 [Nocardia sp. NBC_01730]